MNAELKAELLEALYIGLEDVIRHSMRIRIQDDEAYELISVAIDKLEALTPTTERELAIVRATQSAINAAMFEEYGTSTGVRVDPATILKELK